MQKTFLFIGILISMILLYTIPTFADTGPNSTINTDNTIYNDLLKKHVTNGRVNYDGFKTDEAMLDQYLNILSRTKIDTLSANGQMAFYINTYNAFTIRLILTKYPKIDSIKDLGGFFSSPWSIKFIPLQNKHVTLDYIEHDILRPIFKDPRVHFAVNCASKSCPPLRNEAFEADRINEQLDEQTQIFINNPNTFALKEKMFSISKIFKWFKEDFNNEPIAFIKKYADTGLKEKLDAIDSDIRVKYLDYDWSLNH